MASTLDITSASYVLDSAMKQQERSGQYCQYERSKRAGVTGERVLLHTGQELL